MTASSFDVLLKQLENQAGVTIKRRRAFTDCYINNRITALLLFRRAGASRDECLRKELRTHSRHAIYEACIDTTTPLFFRHRMETSVKLACTVAYRCLPGVSIEKTIKKLKKEKNL